MGYNRGEKTMWDYLQDNTIPEDRTFFDSEGRVYEFGGFNEELLRLCGGPITIPADYGESGLISHSLYAHLRDTEAIPIGKTTSLRQKTREELKIIAEIDDMIGAFEASASAFANNSRH